VTVAEVLSDTLARIVFAREATEFEEYLLAASLLRDLEVDLSAAIERWSGSGRERRDARRGA
jgi:hypothetical protein